MNDALALRTDHVARHYQMGAALVRAVDDVNFHVEKGETLSLVGESGCGKTVLLKTMIGLLRPTRGTVQARRWPAVVAAASRFVCVSAAVADMALAHAVPRDKLVVLPIGVAVPAAPPQPPAGPPCHLFVGRFVAKKGIGVLAEAVRRLRATGDGTPVVCVGDGPERPALEALAGEAGGVTLTGWLPPEAVAVRMAQAWSLLYFMDAPPSQFSHS
jgi:energy-coupling factor transporter ATP-binding protein EcfA2